MSAPSHQNLYDVSTFINSVSTGLVAITANCDNIENWAALVIGSCAGIVYLVGAKIIHKLKIDDAMDSVAQNFFGGVWGLLSTSFFDNEHGLFLSGTSQRWKFLGFQLIGIVVQIAWGSIFAILFFFTMKKLKWLRIDSQIEVIGLDIFTQLRGNKNLILLKAKEFHQKQKMYEKQQQQVQIVQNESEPAQES